MPSEKVICSGLIERIGLENTRIHFKSDLNNFDELSDITSHQIGLEKIAALILDKELGVLNDVHDIDVIGHRVVHGGSKFSNTTLINQNVKDSIHDLIELAPLHNPANLRGIEVAENIFPKAKQIAVFDTAFHQSIPEVAHKYAISNKFYYEHKIRVYGFHGTSHKYVSEKAIEYLDHKYSKIITIHLGNGCSMTAVEDGKSIDHTLGFGPMNGLIMGTRSGDIDQSVIFYLIDSLGYSVEDVSSLLQKEGGMLGLTGFSDLREIELESEKGNKECRLALEMNAYRIKKYIGAYTASLNGLDAIVFTAGIGENSSLMRKLICSNLGYLGINFDQKKNLIRSKELREINTGESKVKILVIPTNEELEIAKQAYVIAN